MNYEQVKKLLKRRERSSVEFKEARRELPRSLFETICSFLNRDGGTILLGVNDAGKVTGIDPDAVDRLTRDIVNLSNNRQKLDPPCILSPEVVDYDGQVILILQYLTVVREKRTEKVSRKVSRKTATACLR